MRVEDRIEEGVGKGLVILEIFLKRHMETYYS